MKKFFLTWLTVILYISIGSVLFSVSVFAEENGGFTYKVIVPENQHNKEVNYFDLRVSPGQEQEVAIRMNNSSSKEITVDVSLNSAKTNTNGVIEYGPSKLEKDKSLKYDFADIVTGEKTVKIPPNQSIDYKMTIKVPDSQFDGVITGGIYMIEKGQTDHQKAMIKNEYGYLVGMILSENDNKIAPELQLNKVYPELQNYRNAIFIDYSNLKPTYIDDMAIDVQIMKKGSEEILYDTKQTKMRMAPNSKIKFPVLMNGERMNAGEYHALVKVTAENDGKWEWDQEFTITDEEADKFNNEDVSLLQENRIDWKLIIIIVGSAIGVVAILFAAIYFIRKKKRLEKEKKKRKRMKKVKK